MSWKNKVIWSEGMFLRPQHFQQQTRYVESLVEGRCLGIRHHIWGFKELKIDWDLTTQGKLAISAARGIFPDGTPFSIPDDDEAPVPLEISEDVRDTIVYLALPFQRLSARETTRATESDGLTRYLTGEDEVRDSCASMESSAAIEVGKLRLSLLLENERRGEYACLGMARIQECLADQKLVLDTEYVPPLLDCGAADQRSDKIRGFIRELYGLLRQRGEALAGRVGGTGTGGSAQISDFLMLQLVNRHQPLLAHLDQVEGVHPEEFYRYIIQLAGEISTFTRKEKRPVEFPPYQHDALQPTFKPVIDELRGALSMVLEQNAISIPLALRRFGIRVGQITDRSLLDTASFVLAVTSQIPVEQLRTRLPSQAKIGPVEHIRELVNVQIPGITLRPMPVAPRQLPFQVNYVYFELERNGEYWEKLKSSGGIAIHVGSDFPGVEMELWAIRGTEKS